MKILYPAFVLALLALAIFSCDNENDNPGGMIYPLSVGNSWEYSREMNLFFYQDSAGTPVYEDTATYTSTASVVITGKETLRDSIETYVFYSEENDSFGTFGTYSGIDYYNNTDSGLYLYAYQSWGPYILPKTQTSSKILFKGKTFNSVRELSNYLQAALPSYRVLSDSIYFEEPPVKSLQYPLKVGARWIYREADDPWRIDKVVTARDTIQVPAGEFSCYKIQWLYDLDDDEQWDEDIAFYDYISSAGLVRRHLIVLGLAHIDAQGNELGYFDVYEKFTLTAVSLE